MKKLIFILTLSIGLMSFATLDFNAEKTGPGNWDWCDGYATAAGDFLGLSDWDEAMVFDDCMGFLN